MPDWLAVIILGIVEGITEFLPISSTGHLIVVENLLPNLPEHLREGAFLVGIQGGAVLAVLAVFKHRVRQLALDYREPATADYLKKIAFSFVLTGFCGLALKKGGWELPENCAPVAWALLIGGILFLLTEHYFKKNKAKKKEPEPAPSKVPEVSWTIALAFAIGQLVAMVFPGASRSGTTILAGLLLGMRRTEAVEFSFLLGVPTLLAASALEIASADPAILTAIWRELLLGTIVSAITAFAAVQWLLRYVQTHTFEAFGWYRIILGGLILYALWINGAGNSS